MKRKQKWLAAVESSALDLPRGIFLSDKPRTIARALKKAAENSGRRRSSPYVSSMSCLCFHINRSGRTLSDERRRILEQAKQELRILFKRE